MSGSPAAPDAFGLTPDTGSYVPREATERVLADLVARVLRGSATIALTGPVGVGKTLLLHLLAERAGPAVRSVYLPNPRFAPDDICAWIAHAVGAPSGEEAEPLLRAWLAHLREQEQACLLLVDDADALPLATARWLAQLVRDAHGGLRVAMAALDGPVGARVLRCFDDVHRVELAASMSLEETAAYVGWRLHRADVPEQIRARFDDAAVAELHRVAQGNPRRLHLAVEAFARSGSVAVLEDEIAAHADGAPSPPEAGAPPSASRVSDEPSDSVTQPARAEPEADATPRRFPLAAVLLAALGAAILALLLLRSEPDPTPQPADRTSAPAPAPLDAPAADEPVAEEPTAPPDEAAPAPPSDSVPVNINASPWARIEIDGVDVGETPLAGLRLRPGPHAFRAQLPDGRIVARSVEIDADHRHVSFE